MDGFLCINKPCGPSSFQIIKQIRHSLRIKKVGHAGTLDPYASGLLVVALGSATRLLQFLPGEPKIYSFGIQFGTQTDSFDSEGKITITGKGFPEPDALKDAVKSCTGECNQVPPEFSAIKVNGVRAYKMARKGEEFTLQARPVMIHSLELIAYDAVSGRGNFKVSCSGGTYVRALVRDLAADLGTCGYASYIERLSAGCFSIDQAVDCNDLGDAAKYIMPAADVFRDFPTVHLSSMQKVKVFNGADIELLDIDSTQVFAYMDNTLLAVLQARGNSVYHPVKVFHGELEN